MGIVTYDGDEKPKLTPAMVREAEKMGMSLIQVICDRPGAKVGDPGLTFIAMVNHLPRVGEIVRTQDKKHCQVIKVVHSVVSVADQNDNVIGFSLTPWSFQY